MVLGQYGLEVRARLLINSERIAPSASFTSSSLGHGMTVLLIVHSPKHSLVSTLWFYYPKPVWPTRELTMLGAAFGITSIPTRKIITRGAPLQISHSTEECRKCEHLCVAPDKDYPRSMI